MLQRSTLQTSTMRCASLPSSLLRASTHGLRLSGLRHVRPPPTACLHAHKLSRTLARQVPGGPNFNNYANVNVIIAVAKLFEADAVWPGWGHASENPALPHALEEVRRDR